MVDGEYYISIIQFILSDYYLVLYISTVFSTNILAFITINVELHLGGYILLKCLFSEYFFSEPHLF